MTAATPVNSAEDDVLDPRIIPAVTQLLVSVSSSTGLVREHNEDAIGINGWSFQGDSPTHLELALPMTGLNSIAVCDGMGGHAGGSTASSLAAQRCTTIEDDAVHDLRTSTAQRVQATSNFLNDVSDSTPDLYGLGTTLVTVLIDAYGSVLVANVGDSRAYRLESGFLGQLTIDHRSEESNRLTQALGGGRRTALEPAFFDCHLDDGGILLCSDGVCDFVSEDALETEMSRTDASRPLSERVVELALAGGGGDNATAVYVRRPDPLTGPRH